MSRSNCCFLTCIQVSQEAGQVIWYSHLFQTFPQFIVTHTVKGFGTVNKAEKDVFLELLLNIIAEAEKPDPLHCHLENSNVEMILAILPNFGNFQEEN